jgi:hypothetical protein
MRRRGFVALISGTALSWPLAIRAQQPSGMPRVGIFSDYSASVAAKALEPFV